MANIVRNAGILALVYAGAVASGCTFTGPTFDDDYRARSWSEKIDLMWDERVLATRYDTLPPLGAGWYLDQATHGLSLIASGLGINQMHEHPGDEMPAGRYKVTHQYGVMAKVELVPAPGGRWGGVFRGAEGLARFALAAPESLFDSFIPALSVKFPISGGDSVDILVTEALPGQGDDRNFFAERFSNIVPPAQPEDGFLLNAVAWHFGTEDPNGDGTRLDLDHTVLRRQDGSEEASGEAPWEILFEPTDEARQLISPSSTEDYRTELMRLDEGELIYTLYGRPGPGERKELIGWLELRSELVASEWGDRHVFFRHRL